MKKYVIGFILGAIIFIGIGVYAGTKIQAAEIEYAPNVSVKDKIDDLYTTANTTLSNKDQQISNLTSEKTNLESTIDTKNQQISALTSQNLELQSTIDALDKKNDVILVTSSWKMGTGWNNYGFGAVGYFDYDYLSFASSTITMKKDCKLKITAIIKNTMATSSKAQFKVLKNNTSILSFSNSSTAENAYNTSNVTVDVSNGDTIYAQMYGGSTNPTYFITYIEVINS